MRRTERILWIAVAALLLGGASAPRECRAEGEPGELRFVVRAYDLSGLARLVRSHPYDSATQPPTRKEEEDEYWSGGSGKGIFEDDAEDAPPVLLSAEAGRRAIRLEELTGMLTAVVDPDSWTTDQFPGSGDAVIKVLGNLLVIRQTEENHKRIAETLDAVRTAARLPALVTIEARWLVADEKALARLAPARGGRSSPVREVDEAALDKADLAVPYRGRITCFSGQAVHTFAGRAQAVLVDMIPVVSSDAVAYRPVMKVIQWGPVLEACTTILPDAKTAVLEVDSTVSELVELRERKTRAIARSNPPNIIQPIEAIDCPDFLAHKLRTTVKVPLDKLVLVGGLSVACGAADAKAPRDERDAMYLLVKVTAEKQEPDR